MKIEDLSASALAGLENGELTSLRNRFLHLYRHYYSDPNFIEKSDARLFTLPRRTFINKYVLLRKELRRRNLRIASTWPLDEEVAERLAKSGMTGIDVPEFGDIVVAEGIISITGPFLKNPKTSTSIDLVVAKAAREEGWELRVAGATSAILGKAASFTYSASGPAPGESHIPMFDLVLRARPETVRIEAKGDGKRKIEKKLSAREKAEFERESETIRENRKKAAATRPHKFKAATWTHPNGHPRCIVCGCEERVGGVCAGIDPETGLEKGKTRGIDYLKSADPEPISKPEVTDTLVRLPVRARVEGHDIRTITINDVDGITALEDVVDKEIVTYLFDREKKWTMEEAKAWVEEHTEKSQSGESIDEKKTAGPDDTRLIKFIKVDTSQHLVGGIIYEPNEVDTQGDFAVEEDITKAMYRFMEKYATQTARIKVQHEGESYSFPIIECFQPETDIRKGGKTVKKGSWWMMVKITNDSVWRDIEEGRLTGFSMGGRARGKDAPTPGK